MLQEQQRYSVNKWSVLSNFITRAEVTLENNVANVKRLEAINTQLYETRQKADRLRAAINRCTAMYKDAQANLDEKKRVSLEDYRAAIKETGEIVAASDVQDMSVIVDGNRAVIANTRGHDINEREGSAERSTVGLLMRYISLVKQPGCVVPIMVFDETFFTMSDNTCDEVRRYLEEFSKHCLIVAVEQKDTLFNGVDNKIIYRFKKEDNGYTKITIEE